MVPCRAFAMIVVCGVDLNTGGRVHLDHVTWLVYESVLVSGASTDEELEAAVRERLDANGVQGVGAKALRMVDAVKLGRQGGNPVIGGMLYVEQWPPSA